VRCQWERREREEERRPRSRAPEVNYRCSFLHPLSRLPQARSRGGRVFLRFFLWVSITISYVLSCVISLVRIILLGNRPGQRSKGSSQRAAIARTADGKHGQKVRRHSLDRLKASMNKQKQRPRLGGWSSAGDGGVSAPEMKGFLRSPDSITVVAVDLCRHDYDVLARYLAINTSESVYDNTLIR